MAINFLLKRSNTASKRPTAAQLDIGELSLNYEQNTAGVFFEDSNGDVRKVGPVEVSASAPNSSPAGSSGNSLGELWYDTGTSNLKIWTGASFVAATATAGAAGSDTQVQFNSTGSLAGSSNFTFDGTSASIAGLIITGTSTFRAAATQDGIKIVGRAGGTSDYDVTLTPTTLSADQTLTLPDATGTVALTADKLSAFAATTSAELAGVISDETGTGSLVFGTSPTFTTGITLTDTDAGAAISPTIDLYRNSASPAASDVLGGLIFNGQDSATNKQEYARIAALIGSATSTAESGILAFYTTSSGTAAQEWMRISGTGAIGIGTISPSRRLDVRGTADSTYTNSPTVAKFTSTNTFAANMGGGIVFGGKYNTAGDITDFAMISGVKENATDGNYDASLTFGTRTNGSGGGNFERMRITAAGRVGINTASPTVYLDINGSTSTSNGGLSNAMLYAGLAPTGGGNTWGGVLLGSGVNGNSPFIASSRNGAGAGLPLDVFTDGTLRAQFSAAGLLGIGAVNGGSAKVRIYADVAASTTVQYLDLHDGSATDDSVVRIMNSPYTGNPGSTIDFVQNSASNFESQIVFGTNNGSGNGEAMRITKDRYVGINNTNPATPLDVTGSVTIDDKIIHSGDTDTCIRFATTDVFTVETGGTERIRVNNTGLGVGATNPSANIDVRPYSGNAASIAVRNSPASDGSPQSLIMGTEGPAFGGRAYFDTTKAGVAGDTPIDFRINSSTKACLDTGGRLLIGTTTNTGGALFQIDGDRFRVGTAKTPASASDTGSTGEICWDASYIYVCTATNTWKRVAIATW